MAQFLCKNFYVNTKSLASGGAGIRLMNADEKRKGQEENGIDKDE